MRKSSGLQLVLLLATAACIGVARAGPSRAMEYQLETYVKPCALEGRHCPQDGSVGNLSLMEREIPELTREFHDRELNQATPEACRCNRESCIRACWYELTKAVILSDFQGFLAERRRR